LLSQSEYNALTEKEKQQYDEYQLLLASEDNDDEALDEQEELINKFEDENDE